jgi:hypothetical protein
VKYRAHTILCLAFVAGSSVAFPQQRTREATYAVFDAVLDSLYRSQGDKPDIVIVADSLFAREAGIAYKGKFLLSHRSVIDLSTIESFESVTNRSIPFPVDYRYKHSFHLLSGNEREALLERGRKLVEKIPPKELRENPEWIAFREKYTKAWGFTVLSNVGFNTDSTEALIFVRHQCGGNCYSSEVLLLDKLPSGWRIADRISLYSQESIGPGSLRYLGPGAHFIADMKWQRDSTRWAVADSIRRDRAPRRIRGTVYNRLMKTPLPSAQIFARSASPYPTGSTQRVVADARGRYEILNPPIGGMMLEVQCPGVGHRLGATLDAPSMYVFPMLDTIVDVGPPNLEPCWRARRAHRISSGELEARSKIQLEHPSIDEKEIYSAIVRELHIDSTGFLVEAETGPWCDWRYDCPMLSIAHLIRNGEVDLSTLKSFRKVAQDSLPLNPDAMRDIAVRLLTHGERSYVDYEAGQMAQFSADTAGRITPWSVVFDLYETSTLVSVTRIGFNDARDEAIVAIRPDIAEDWESETILMKRIDNEWRVSRRHLDAEHPSGITIGGSCVAATPEGKLFADEIDSILGDYDFRLVSSATDDRVTSWRMRFLRDSSKRNVFEVLDPVSGERRRSLEPGTNIDASGTGFMNAAGILQFDGDGFTITIDKISGGNLFGHWEHYSFGIPTGPDRKPIPEPAGHFCATRRTFAQ